MKKNRAAVPCLIALVYVSCLLVTNPTVQAAAVTISTDQALYPVWGVGGTVRVTAQNLPPNITYYLWSQNPNQIVSNFTQLSFVLVNGGVPSPLHLTIPPHDPPGTYLLSLSRSPTSDTHEATAHFGVLGADSVRYERTQTVTVAGGGFAPNSTITLTINSGKGAYLGFPINITASSKGGFEYHFRLPPSAETGNIDATFTGPTYDKRQLETAKSTFSVSTSLINVQPFKQPVSQVERTLPVSASYVLSYVDGSPVTTANTSAYIILSNQTLYRIPLVLVNSTSGEWNATWTPSASTTNASYHFQFTPTNFTDPYGNRGNGSPLSSSTFKVIPAKLQPVIQASQTLQRTQTSIITITAAYPNGTNIKNITQSSIIVTTSRGMKIKLAPSLNAAESIASFKIPVNASLGNWTAVYNMTDPWDNPGSGLFLFHVQPASLTFEPQIQTTQRTTLLNLTNTIYYPDRTTLNSTVTVQVVAPNQTWTPPLNYDPTSGKWSGSIYIVQNATTGPYNVTWVAVDQWGNGGNDTYQTLVTLAYFSFKVQANNSTAAPPLSNLDLPVIVRYPNGTSLTDGFGNVTGTYSNTTGYVFVSPLVYNETNATWHMYFTVPAQNNATLSFNATDRFGNTAVAMDAYNLKIVPVPKVITQNLIIAGVIGVLVPMGLLIWAFATISARRRKHRP